MCRASVGHTTGPATQQRAAGPGSDPSRHGRRQQRDARQVGSGGLPGSPEKGPGGLVVQRLLPQSAGSAHRRQVVAASAAYVDGRLHSLGHRSVHVGKLRQRYQSER